MWRTVLGYAASAINAVTVGCTVNSILAQHSSTSSSARDLVAFATGILWLAWMISRLPDQSSHYFSEGSRRIGKYFGNWYRQDGVIYVYCNDAEWLANPNFDQAVRALKAKGDHARLCIRDTSHALVREFVESGVKVYQIPRDIGHEIRMSLVASDGEKRLIIRDKSYRSAVGWDMIIFRETSDNHQCNLAMDLISQCEAAGKQVA